MTDYVSTLSELFTNLDPNFIAYYDITPTGCYYRQSFKTVVVKNIYFDIKRSGFLKPADIQNNLMVLSKLTQYNNDDHLISFTPTVNGFYVQVFNKLGSLVYAQYIRFFSYNRFLNWLAKKRFPELVLITRKF